MLNLNKHAVNIVKADGNVITIEPSGTEVRVSVTQEVIGTHEQIGVNIAVPTYGEIENMPTLEEAKQAGGVLVSGLVLSRLGQEWHNVAYAPDTNPNSVVRDEETGKIIGVKQLVTV